MTQTELVVDEGAWVPKGADPYRVAQAHKKLMSRIHNLGFGKRQHKCQDCGYHVCRCDHRQEKEYKVDPDNGRR